MNEHSMGFVFFFFIGISVLNFAIAVVARMKTKNTEFNSLIVYWPAVIFTFMAASVLRDNPTEMAYSYFLQFFSSNLMAHMMRSSLRLQTNWKFFLTVQLASMLFSGYLLNSTEACFTASLIPVSAAFSLPFIRPIWFALVEHRDRTNWVEKCMAYVFITAVLHHFNFALFRLEPNTEAISFAVTTALYQCMSIFLPLLINHRREISEKENIRQVLERMSGAPTGLTSIPDHYQQLDVQITQKEHLLKELQTSHLQLEEERNVNEMLIRTISHDLANPLTVIAAYTEMLNAGKIPEKDQEKVRARIQANTQSALDMIERIRHAIVTRTQASLVEVKDVSLYQALSWTLESFEPRLSEKDLTVNLEDEAFRNVRVLAEEKALREHVFANIISNAIKFSYPGGIINISVTDRDESIEVCFQDFGTGIKKSRLETKLLLSTPGTSGESGTGFGLMVMGYFLRQFGASLKMTSFMEGPERGTTVMVVLKKAQNAHHFSPGQHKIAAHLNVDQHNFS